MWTRSMYLVRKFSIFIFIYGLLQVSPSRVLEELGWVLIEMVTCESNLKEIKGICHMGEDDVRQREQPVQRS